VLLPFPDSASRKGRNAGEEKSPSDELRPFSPAGGGQDEGVLTQSICSESEPPHPSLSPLGRGSRTPCTISLDNDSRHWVGANHATFTPPAVAFAARPRASSAGWSTTWCIGTPAACPDRRSGAPSAPSARLHGNPTGSA